MKIESYAVGMSSVSVATKGTSVTQKALVNGGNNPLLNSGGGMLGNLFGGRRGRAGRPDVFAFSQDSQAWLANQREGRRERPAASALSAELSARARPAAHAHSELSDKDRMKIILIQRMIEALTGKKYKFDTLDRLRTDGGLNFQPMQMAAAPNITLERTETYYEFQQMAFQASGVVNTSDGRQIQFDLNILASYEFSSSLSTTVEGVRLCDPLVINFDGTLPEFTKDRYEFDLTISGSADNIFMPTNGSGFLALDKNGDGVINDGAELFGAQTGNGFWELMAYDDDGNGWIDEGDSVFDQLKIMFVDRDSDEFMLMSLKDSGVGAIYLGSALADYELKGADNELMGVVRRNGIFLNENGTVGSIHHIDLTY